ncbi:60s ribosome biogenesis protein mak11 [Coemansia sp. RSA 1813]|nr:Protein mak11 [Coemansia sp. RSA 1646]KAJ1768734.1 60s ribosome biogenesis protein mak11 [Coemansia sp. RSA 1843]KAJ2086737.1 60s ribosome biogenesis protein mak11 [Coemansia sp. RSA 986]KAJ2211472.1 60s ribosome biogenesis protein mak11 [Coemansia sp. RSA 487]KAJ2571624.1 60s ribosome biogenesis protein mak11 [Coemansia sp. RSA 1813]
MATGQRKRTKVDKSSRTSSTDSPTADSGLPVLPENEPAEEAFLISAGTYERILYGLEGRFVGEQLTLKPLFIFPAHIGCIKSVSIGGRFLASGSTDEIVRLYDLKKRVELGSLHEHKGSITSLHFHGHSHLLSASEDGAICIFRTKDWEPLKVLKGHKGPINDIAIHPSGKLALSVSQDRTVIVWNLLTGQRASRTKTPQPGELVVWNPSGSFYAIAYATEIQIYNVGQAEPTSTIFSRQRILSVLAVAYKGTDYVVSGCQDKRIRIYAIDGTELASAQCHDNRIKGLSSVDMIFPDGSIKSVVVSISSDGRIKVWRLADIIEPVLKSAKGASASDALDLKIEPLATYNADVRLTCVSTSNNPFS